MNRTTQILFSPIFLLIIRSRKFVLVIIVICWYEYELLETGFLSSAQSVGIFKKMKSDLEADYWAFVNSLTIISNWSKSPDLEKPSRSTSLRDRGWVVQCFREHLACPWKENEQSALRSSSRTLESTVANLKVKRSNLWELVWCFTVTWRIVCRICEIVSLVKERNAVIGFSYIFSPK